MIIDVSYVGNPTPKDAHRLVPDAELKFLVYLMFASHDALLPYHLIPVALSKKAEEAGERGLSASLDRPANRNRSHARHQQWVARPSASRDRHMLAKTYSTHTRHPPESGRHLCRHLIAGGQR